MGMALGDLKHSPQTPHRLPRGRHCCGSQSTEREPEGPPGAGPGTLWSKDRLREADVCPPSNHTARDLPPQTRRIQRAPRYPSPNINHQASAPRVPAPVPEWCVS